MKGREQSGVRDFWSSEDVSDARLEVELLLLALDREGHRLPVDCMCVRVSGGGEGFVIILHVYVNNDLAHKTVVCSGLHDCHLPLSRSLTHTHPHHARTHIIEYMYMHHALTQQYTQHTRHTQTHHTYNTPG